MQEFLTDKRYDARVGIVELTKLLERVPIDTLTSTYKISPTPYVVWYKIAKPKRR